MVKSKKKTFKHQGRRIAREFEGQGTFYGTVDDYDADYCLWHITYDDGDVEEFNHSELIFATDMFQGNSDRSYIGRRVSREFGSQVCHGNVNTFNSRQRIWKVALDYGEVIEMDHRELIYALDLFESNAAPVPTGSPEAAKYRATTKSKRRKNKSTDDDEEEEDVQLFAFRPNNDPSVKEEQGPGGRPRRKLKTTKRFDPTSYASQAHCPTGHGFACPRCSSICSYDARECEECYMECCYEPGVGVVVIKERQASPRRQNRAKIVTSIAAYDPNGINDDTEMKRKSTRKSVEDVTEIFLAMKEEEIMKRSNDALEIS